MCSGKICAKCGESKIYSKNGRRCYCAKCARIRARAYRASNLEKVREYDRARGGGRDRTYIGSDKQKSDTREWRTKNRPKYKYRHYAGTKLKRAITKGSIRRSACEICGEPKAEGHHRDYTKPLDVVWLCNKHHNDEHKKIRKDARMIKNKIGEIERNEVNMTDAEIQEYRTGYVNGLAFALDLFQGSFPFTQEEAIYRLKAVFDARVKKMTEDSK